MQRLDKPLLLVVGEDVPLNDIVLTNALTFVGRFGGRKFSVDDLHSWASNTWLGVIGIFLKFFILTRGWIAFQFQNTVDVDYILKGVWKWENSSLFLKCWTPLFDPRVERYDSLPIWVKLPNLPFEF